MGVSRLRESDSDALLPVSIGTAIWAVALAALLIAKPALDENGTTWWIITALVGVITGLGGLVFLTWRKRRAMQRRRSA
jgi:hypothetical protein